MKEVKIKFKKFDIIYEKHSYLVLIPEHTENIRMCNYGNAYWGTNWLGDREAFQTLMYSVAVLGFNPNDKIIYFPLRKNKRLPSFDLPGAFPGEKQNEVEDCDLVMTTHDVPLQRSKWKKIKEIMKYTKSDTYTFNYDEERTEAYFRDKIKQWERSDTYYKEKYAVETMESRTLFYVFGRMQFQEVYLNLKSYLQGR